MTPSPSVSTKTACESSAKTSQDANQPACETPKKLIRAIGKLPGGVVRGKERRQELARILAGEVHFEASEIESLDGALELGEIALGGVLNNILLNRTNRTQGQSAGTADTPESLLLGAVVGRDAGLSDREACVKELNELLVAHAHLKNNLSDQVDLYMQCETTAGRFGFDIEDLRDRLPGLPEKKEDRLFREPIEVDTKNNRYTSNKLLMPLFEHPFFRLSSQLSTKREERIMNYRCEKTGAKIQITPDAHAGWATFSDQAILVFCVAHIRAAADQKKIISPILHTTGEEILRAIHKKGTSYRFGGSDYKELQNAFSRLKGVSIKTNIPTPYDQTAKGKPFKDLPVQLTNLITDIKYEEGKTHFVGRVTITLSQWAFEFILAKCLLSLPTGYLALDTPLEIRLYEIGHKLANGKGYRGTAQFMPIKRIYELSGSSREFKYFARDLRAYFGASKDCPNGEEKILLDLRMTLDAANKGVLFLKDA